METTDKNGFIRKIIFHPAYDRRSKDMGIHPMEIHFVLQGPDLAVDFGICTGNHLKHIRQTIEDSVSPYPYTTGINYHSAKQIHDYQSPSEKCPYLNDRPCYSDGSMLAGMELMEIFLLKGEDPVWEKLEETMNQLMEQYHESR